MRGTVLLADDESAFLQTLANTLEGAGYRTITACCGREALGIERLGEVDAVIIEPNLPGKSWWGVLEELRFVGLLRVTNIVTAYPSRALYRRARQLRVKSFLTKPIAPGAALAMLEQGNWTVPQTHRPRTLAAAEWECLNDAIFSCAGNISRAASLLGIPRQTLYRKLRKYPPPPPCPSFVDPQWAKPAPLASLAGPGQVEGAHTLRAR